MKVRSLSWGAANISWSVVIEELLYSMENMGHDVCFASTNGYKGMKYWDAQKALDQDFYLRKLLRDGGSFDLDLTYTVPQNFPKRFLKNSKTKMAIYAYESSIMPEHWRNYYQVVDYVLPPSEYVAEMMRRNGCPEEKIQVVPHGVDLNIFNQQAEPLDLKTDKKVKFLCVAEPHYRKQLDRLLDVYCQVFSSKDDVCLVLKTKIFKPGDDMRGFEMDLRPILLSLKKKYGKDMPEIKVISKRLKNIAGLYTVCDAFALMTASEGWGVPYLEALATGLPVIAPKHGGQLQFLDDDNAILTKCGVRKARVEEQYWKPNKRAVVGDPDEHEFGNAMYDMYQALISDSLDIKAKLDTQIKNGLLTAQFLTWNNAASQILELVR